MIISNVRIENYRNIKQIDVPLTNPVTLIGENNAGKANFLRALTLPLSPDENQIYKQLSWIDINDSAKENYYQFIIEHRMSIIDESLKLDEFKNHLPEVIVKLSLQPGPQENYDVKDLLYEFDGDGLKAGLQYRFYAKKSDEIFERVKVFLREFKDSGDKELKKELNSIKMSLLPTELYDYSITIPGKGTSVPYDILKRFKYVMLPAERDEFARSSNRMGSTLLNHVLQHQLSSEDCKLIEREYSKFFEVVKETGHFDKIINWKDTSPIPNIQNFLENIEVVPNMPNVGNIVNSVKLSYGDSSLSLQGLGERNLILLFVLMNAFSNDKDELSFRLINVEEPEAHLCPSNVLLLASYLNVISKGLKREQIVYSSHSSEFVNKVGLDKVVVFHEGNAFSLQNLLTKEQCDYLSKFPNTDLFKVLFSRRVILVEGITEELLIKSYLQTRDDLNDIKVISFHKGYKDIIKIWSKVNAGTSNKLGVVRDYDNQPDAQKEHEKLQSNQVCVVTTKEYTLEPEIVNAGKNYKLLIEHYGAEYGWDDLTTD